MIKESLEYPLKYIRDLNGNTPLSLALKRNSFEAVNLLLEYITRHDNLMAQLNN
jgi:ankyrin repeat protein